MSPLWFGYNILPHDKDFTLDMKLTWLLEQDLLDVGVVEMFMPMMPFSSGEAEMATGHLQVRLGPVARIGAH